MSNFSNTDDDLSEALPSERPEKTISRTTNRLGITAMATAGLIWPVLVLSANAAADPSPGVPCLDMVRQFAPVAEAPAAPLAAAPVTDAAGVVPAPAAAPPVPVPAVPLPAAVPPVPSVPVPIVPLADAVPGFPLLPSALPMPHDLVCEGTAWSAKRGAGGHATPHDELVFDRRDQW